VALLLRNSIEFLEASIATVPLGASAVPINWHWRSEEIAHVLSDSGAKALIAHADLWPEIAPSVPDGVAVVLAPARGEDSILAEERVTVVQMVPTMFVRLLALAQEVRSRYDISSLRWVVHAAAPCPPDVKRAMIDWLGPIGRRVLRRHRDRPGDLRQQ
jgi:acyl-CoA synthetase (AMP-forming)/AMP-acid ligase II